MRKRRTGTAGRRCLTPQQVNLSQHRRQRVGASIKCVGSLVTPNGIPTVVAHRMAHKMAPGTLRACRAIAVNRPHSATSAPGAKVTEHQRVGFRIGQHQPGIAKTEDGDKQADGGRQSQLDRLRHRAGDHFAQAKAGQQEEEDPRPAGNSGPVCQPIPSLPASVTPTSTEPPMPGPTINGRLA